MNTQTATDIERIVLAYLDKHKIEYEFQSTLLGGYYELGGSVVDFTLPDRNLAWRVHGEFWHSGVEVEGRDMVHKELLEAEGWTVIDLWGDDIMNRLEQTMHLALQGESMIR